MPSRAAEPIDVYATDRFLAARGLTHLRARKYGVLVIIESGPPEDPWPRARLRRDTVHLWWLEMSVKAGKKWERTGMRGTREELLTALVDQFGWVLIDYPDFPT